MECYWEVGRVPYQVQGVPYQIQHLAEGMCLHHLQYPAMWQVDMSKHKHLCPTCCYLDNECNLVSNHGLWSGTSDQPMNAHIVVHWNSHCAHTNAACCMGASLCPCEPTSHVWPWPQNNFTMYTLSSTCMCEHMPRHVLHTVVDTSCLLASTSCAAKEWSIKYNG